MCLFPSVAAKEGDAHPLGALPVGTLINNLELLPGKGASAIRAAGMWSKYNQYIVELLSECLFLPWNCNRQAPTLKF